MKVLNKWNKKYYYIVKEDGSKVILVREDGTEFVISIKEFNKSYIRLGVNND